MLQGHLEEFKPFLEEGRIQMRAFDVKKDFYRPLHMLIGALGLYYGLKSHNTLELLQELVQQGLISQAMAQKLQETLTCVLSLRLRAHFFYHNQREIFYYEKEADEQEAVGLCLIQEEESHLVLEIYRVLVPLQKLMQAFVQGNRQVFIHATCYEANVGVRTQEAEDTLDYEVAQKAYLQRAALNPHDLQALDDVRRIKLTLGQAQAALNHSLDLLAMLRHKYGDKPHLGISRTLCKLGHAYLDLGETRKALAYYEQSLAMHKQFFGEKPHPTIAATLGNLGSAYERLGETQKALAYFEQSLAMHKQLFDNKPHPSIAISLNNLGNAYYSLGEIQKALAYYEQSLAMHKQLFGEKPHPTTAITLNSLGTVYQKLGDNKKAAAYFEKAKAMARK